MLQNYSTGVEFGLNGQFGAEVRFASLTSREREILLELVKAANVKLVAKNLNISRFTVNQHLRSIYAKLGVNTKLEAVTIFFSYAHSQAIKDECTKPENIHCKVRGANGCEIMLCFLASFCKKDEFCFLDSGCAQVEPQNDSTYKTTIKTIG